jgi:hypothetical protein
MKARRLSQRVGLRLVALLEFEPLLGDGDEQDREHDRVEEHDEIERCKPMRLSRLRTERIWGDPDQRDPGGEDQRQAHEQQDEGQSRRQPLGSAPPEFHRRYRQQRRQQARR